ncbi:MAG: SDR family oxidoreductase [Alphaproteobacteria bacterium]|jgi:3-oxoacyl-[acyl-carrier protein] reductase|nr:SDR family oxidoreductase [Alphaproteobacteria bacterium]
MTDDRFSGRVAIVTGGGQGIGRAIANRLHREGAAVFVWDVDENAVADLKSVGEGMQGLVVDITDADATARASSDVLSAAGKIDILVNSAGISGPNVPTWEYDVAAWRRVIDIDLTGTFLVARAVVPALIKNGYGRVVNIASIAGKEGNPNAPAYSAAKAGVIALTKSLGKELADKGVIVNCVTPAAVKTAIFDQMSEEHINYMLSKIPLGRFGQVEEIASLVTWLASEECSFSTGAAFDISGGRATY